MSGESSFGPRARSRPCDQGWRKSHKPTLGPDAIVREYNCHASRQPEPKKTALRHFRSRSRCARTHKARQALAASRAALSVARDAVGETGSIGDERGIAAAAVASDG